MQIHHAYKSRIQAGISTAALAAALMLPAIGSAQAQVAPAQVAQAAPAAVPDQLEEVTVTARYRAENVQTTPISITALTGDEADARGYTSVMDIANTAPNVSIQPSSGQWSKSAQAFIRGVGQEDFEPALSPGVGFYIDDVYFDSVAGSELDLLDLDRVEVERGPQGTLYGKNTEGGAIRMFTVKPKGDNSGYVEAGYGSFNRERFRGAFDVSVVPDKLFVRVSGGSNTDDGYQKLIDFACAHPDLAGKLKPTTTAPGCQIGTLGGDDVQDGRIAIRALPVDGLEINLSADILDDRGESPAQTELLVNSGTNGTGIGPKTGFNPYAGTTLSNLNSNYLLPVYNFAITPRTIPSSPYVSYAGLYEPVTGETVPPTSTMLQYGFTGAIDWDVIPGQVHAKSITAFRSYSGQDGFDNSPTPYPLQPSIDIVTHSQVSQEEDFTGDLDLFGNKLEWTLGGYYLSSDSGWAGSVAYDTNLSLFPSPAPFDVTLPNGQHYTKGQIIPGGQPEPYLIDVNDKRHDDTEAGFIHAVYHITDALSFEGGYRYSVENRSYAFDHVVPYFTVPELLVTPGTVGQFSFPRSDAKAAFQYQWTPELMTYASVSTGFKAGASIRGRSTRRRSTRSSRKT